MAATFRAIVIGAGHNGLVTACYLARAGWKVLVLERRYVVGGACVTEEIWSGYKVSTAAYVNSLLRPEIIRDLELARHGFEMLPRNPSSFTPFPDGRSLLMGADVRETHTEVSKFSRKDADALPKYEAMLMRVAEFLEPLLDETPPNPFGSRIGDFWRLGKIGWQFRKLGKDALITDPGRAAEQAVRMAMEGKVRTITGKVIDAKVETICIHGDSPGSDKIVAAVREGLVKAGAVVKPLRDWLPR